jgi:hypoxanthine phosphoribosyltransferase
MLSSKDRFDMLRLAFIEEDKVEISDFEIKSQGVSYTYLTVQHFKNVYKDAKLYLIMGSDMLENFPTWKNPEIIVNNVELVLINRKGSEKLNDQAINKIKEFYNKEVLFLKTEGETLSSTEIRTRIKLGIQVEEYIPKNVLEYIKSNNLYKNDKYYDYVNKVLPEKRKLHTLGVIITAKELAKKLKHEVTFNFMKVSSYGNSTESSGRIKIDLDLDEHIKGKDVLVIEDIVDTGRTLKHLKDLLSLREPASLKICTLLDKPERRKVDLSADFVGFVVPDEFVVGYGLDYDEKYRTFDEVYILKREVYEK